MNATLLAIAAVAFVLAVGSAVLDINNTRTMRQMEWKGPTLYPSDKPKPAYPYQYEGPTPPPPPAYQPTPKRRGHGWKVAFIVWNILAALYFVLDIVVVAAQTHSDCVNTGEFNQLCHSVHNTALGGTVVVMLVIWAIVSGILFLIWRVAQS